MALYNMKAQIHKLLNESTQSSTLIQQKQWQFPQFLVWKKVRPHADLEPVASSSQPPRPDVPHQSDDISTHFTIPACGRLPEAPRSRLREHL